VSSDSLPTDIPFVPLEVEAVDPLPSSMLRTACEFFPSVGTWLALPHETPYLVARSPGDDPGQHNDHVTTENATTEIESAPEALEVQGAAWEHLCVFVLKQDYAMATSLLPIHRTLASKIRPVIPMVISGLGVDIKSTEEALERQVQENSDIEASLSSLRLRGSRCVDQTRSAKRTEAGAILRDLEAMILESEGNISKANDKVKSLPKQVCVLKLRRGILGELFPFMAEGEVEQVKALQSTLPPHS